MFFSKKKLRPKKTFITLHVVHLPILLLILGLLVISAFISSKALAINNSKDTTAKDYLGYVLGDDDEDDEDKDEDRDDDKDEDEDKDEDRDDDKDEDEDKDEYEYEYKYENKFKEQERTLNSDGTYSITKTEFEGDKVKIETKTYNAAGKLISEEKHEGSDEGFESEVEDSTGNKIKVRVQNTEVLVKREGISGLKNFPLFIDESDGTVYVETSNGDVRLGVTPQSVVEKAESASGNVVTVEEIEIESEVEDKLEFRLRTKKTEKLFGIFALEIPSTVYFDVQNGEELRSEQTFINKLLDTFSF